MNELAEKEWSIICQRKREARTREMQRFFEQATAKKVKGSSDIEREWLEKARPWLNESVDQWVKVMTNSWPEKTKYNPLDAITSFQKDLSNMIDSEKENIFSELDAKIQSYLPETLRQMPNTVEREKFERFGFMQKSTTLPRIEAFLQKCHVLWKKRQQKKKRFIFFSLSCLILLIVGSTLLLLIPAEKIATALEDRPWVYQGIQEWQTRVMSLKDELLSVFH